MELLQESVTLPPDTSVMDGNGQGYPLFITAKRYFVRDFGKSEEDVDAVTIIALHSTSFHKETWEPTLEALFRAAAIGEVGKVNVREVWAVDCPNHGEAGVLNQEVLKRDEFANDFSCERYAIAIHRFLVNAPKMFGVDFGKRRLVGLGHSLGANTLLLLQGLKPVFPFLSLIIVEPMVSPDDDRPLAKLRAKLVDAAKRRVFEWQDRETAYLSLKSNPRTAKWDERVLRAFVKHAVVKFPLSETVSLACTREQEQAMYLDIPGATKPVEELTRLCSSLPIHLIIGLQNDFIPRKVHEALLDPKSGRKYATVTEVPEVGHLIPQEIPNKLGTLVYKTLTLILERSAKL